jgi:hypothetical protein
MKKVIVFLVLALVAAGVVFGQEGGAWYNSYAEGIDQKLLLNVGIGLGPTGGYDLGFPPVSASVDFKLPIQLPITVGGIFTFSRWKYSWGFSGTNYDFAWNNIGIGARGMYHFNFLKNLDTYAGLTLGWVIQSFDGGDYDESFGGGYAAHSFFLYGFNVGARYFFTKNIGAYLELGYSGLQFLSAGLSLKFL